MKLTRELVVAVPEFLVGLESGRDDGRTLRIEFLKKEVVLILTGDGIKKRDYDNAPVEGRIITLCQQWVVGPENEFGAVEKRDRGPIFDVSGERVPAGDHLEDTDRSGI